MREFEGQDRNAWPLADLLFAIWRANSVQACAALRALRAWLGKCLMFRLFRAYRAYRARE